MWRPITTEEQIPGFNIANAEYDIWENAVGNQSNNIIRIGSVWGVRVRWQNNGWLIPFFNPAISWRITCFLEQYGPGEGPALPALQVPFNIGPVPVAYDANLTFNPPLVPEGTYQFALRIRLIGPPPLLLPMPLGCMADGPMLDFYAGP